MSLVGNCHLLSKILLITLFCHLQYSRCQFVNKSLLCHPDQSLALLQFKSNFVINPSAAPLFCGDQTYPKTETWKEGTDCCSSWEGVTCHPVSGHVISLDLSSSQLQLQGTTIEGSAIFSLGSLQKLNLACNDFNGSNIPSQVSQLAPTLTHLNLHASYFIGNIPSEISQLSNLVSLDLSWNSRLRLKSDGVVKSIAHNLTHLRVLNLDLVNMSSVLQPAYSMMNLSSSLISLSLQGCSMQGKFPDWFLLIPSLQELILSVNEDLKGGLPKSWSNRNTTHSSNLRVLDLRATPLSGELPSDFFANLKSLIVLDLSDCDLSGSIPASLGNLTKITRLFLDGNQLRGQIPNEILNLTQLENLVLSSNQLEGPLPSSPSHEHTVLFPHLFVLFLSDNLLNGSIPSWLFALPSVGIIELEDNSFTGHLDEFVSQSLIILSLNNNKLFGPIPRNLSKSLRYIDLKSNFLEGPLPALPLTTTSFSASSNNLTGEISILCEATSLEVLDLSSNKLFGPIPRNLSKSLGIIDLHSNLLQGPLPALPLATTYFSVSSNNCTGEISSILCEATSLEVLNLSSNKLFGLIPQCLQNFTNLSALNLGMNNFHGSIPDTFFKGSKLRSLNLNDNQFTGMVPRSLANCQELELLDLGSNLISDVFPEWLGVIPQLQVLVLRSNKFYGLVDTNVEINHSFPMLRILDLSNNNFSGALPTRLIKNLKGMMNIPAHYLVYHPLYMGRQSYDFSVHVNIKGNYMELTKILTIFTSIDFSNNMFEGTIPNEVGNLRSLKGFSLSNNCLVGSIPPAIGKLVNLEWLDLSSDKLVGRIPAQLVDLKFLAVLNLSHNNLHGPIPIGKQFNTFEVDSYEGNMGLCGFPLPTCGSGRLHPPSKSSFQNKDSFDSTIELSWKSVVAGYGCGMIFGICMGYLAFSTGSPKWFIRMAEGKRSIMVRKSKKNAKVGGRRRN